MKMFITSKNKYLLNDMNIFGTCSIPLNKPILVYMACEKLIWINIFSTNKLISFKVKITKWIKDRLYLGHVYTNGRHG